jgi:predicted nucleotide-binding protein
MRVFLSWSGERSKRVASALHGWLPLVLQTIRPWFFSGQDINVGSRWLSVIDKELEESRFAIICLNPENLDASWLNFEAGAIAKSMQQTFVFPYLCGFESCALSGPLAQFQTVRATNDDTWRLVHTMNRALGDSGIREEQLRMLFDLLWPGLEKQLKEIELVVPPVVSPKYIATTPKTFEANSAFDTLSSKISQLEDPIRTLVATPNPATSTSSAPRGQNVFLVHGRNEGVKETVARFLEKLGTVATILQELPNEGRTVIEKFEDFSEAGYAVVLMTGDDVGNVSGEPAQRFRARQNVVFELGYFVAKLGRRRVCVLYQDGVEIPSDFAGVLYVKLDHEGGWRLNLAREIRTAGIGIDLNKVVE